MNNFILSICHSYVSSTNPQQSTRCRWWFWWCCTFIICVVVVLLRWWWWWLCFFCFVICRVSWFWPWSCTSPCWPWTRPRTCRRHRHRRRAVSFQFQLVFFCVGYCRFVRYFEVSYVLLRAAHQNMQLLQLYGAAAIDCTPVMSPINCCYWMYCWYVSHKLQQCGRIIPEG